MKKKLHTPEGVRDIYNVECGKKLALESRLKNIFSNLSLSTQLYTDWMVEVN